MPGVTPALAERAWAALNDAYRTDLVLVHPPSTLALGALCIAGAAIDADVGSWLHGIAYDANAIHDVVRGLVQMYACQAILLGCRVISAA
jgi:hypothetical protein